MAIATITGNQVDIPDFALENTQEDILEKIGQMVSALGGVQSEVSQGNTTEQAQLREEKKQTSEQKQSMLQNIRNNIKIFLNILARPKEINSNFAIIFSYIS